MNIKSEKDVRKIVRGILKDQDIPSFWIEPALGSTPGLPDLFWRYEDRPPVYCELKLAQFYGKRGCVSFEYQKEQPRTLKSMRKAGFDVVLTFGMVETDALFVAPVNSMTLTGRFPLDAFFVTKWQPSAGSEKFLQIVNFTLDRHAGSDVNG